jgi:hypothetical protein
MDIAANKTFYQFKNEDQNLFKTYICRLFYNNWRMKQLFSKPFAYSENFYISLHKMINI